MKNPELGYVGEVETVDPAPVKLLLEEGYMPVVAPISFGSVEGRVMLLNVNGDAAAGEIAAALTADKLIFLTDVDGVHDASGRVISRLNITEARALLRSEVATGGMVPKIEASIKALAAVSTVHIIDGRMSHALLSVIENSEIPRLSSERVLQSQLGGTSIVPG